MINPLLAVHSHAELLAYDAAIMRSRGRPFYNGGSGTCLAMAATSASPGESMSSATMGGFQSNITSGGGLGVVNTVAAIGDLQIGETVWFGTAAVSRTVTNIAGNVVTVSGANFTTVANEIMVAVRTSYKMAFAMAYNDIPRRVKGIGVLRATNPPSGTSIDMNLSLWPNKINTNDWNPDTAGLIDSNAWGTVNIPVVTGAVRAFIATLQAPVILPVGYFFYGNLYKFNTGIGGSFISCALTRLEGAINGATVGNSRYDQKTTTVIPYVSTTPTAVLSGKAFDETTGGALVTTPQSIDYFLWCDPL